MKVVIYWLEPFQSWSHNLGLKIHRVGFGIKAGDVEEIASPRHSPGTGSSCVSV